MSKQGTIFNVNFPDINPKDVLGRAFVAFGKHLYTDNYIKTGKNRYMLVGKPMDKIDNIEKCDVEYSRKGYITITPVLFDKTDYNALKELDNL